MRSRSLDSEEERSPRCVVLAEKLEGERWLGTNIGYVSDQAWVSDRLRVRSER